jgi:hypothetical protein
LIVVVDTAYRRTVIEPHILRLVIHLDGVGRGGLTGRREQQGRLRRPLFGSDLLCDGAHPPDGTPHLPLGVAVGFQDRLGHIP